MERQILDGLFALFAVCWPKDWLDRVTLAGGVERLASEWGKGLAGIGLEQFKRGVSYARRHYDYAPSIAKFRRACLGLEDGQGGSNAEQRARDALMARQRAEQAALPNGTWAERRERGRQHLAGLRAALGGDQRQDAPSDDEIADRERRRAEQLAALKAREAERPVQPRRAPVFGSRVDSDAVPLGDLVAEAKRRSQEQEAA
ncbi:hypothetical protein [Marichromatium gracile]|uniref:Uncharacterized protein n=1 Tax=Marichromatium gracile TaxID=1048 RepID=A0A4R4A5D1_MARGR|nr:hypothetical protein [Marichromatium gracile]MBK1709819.1 hypothetical protein [Marichromatium gracile]TCW32670.1 hypothetical protein EDC29_11736 [Marichromatium gracile]